MTDPATLVLVGGHPGEWEDEHPRDTVARIGAEGVVLAGWHDQEDLPELLSAADLLVLSSSRESFGQVLVEGMACGLAPVATASNGPARIVDDGETGWLVPVGDRAALAAALADAVNRPDERARRAAAAAHDAAERFSWPAIAARMAAVLEDAAGRSDADAAARRAVSAASRPAGRGGGPGGGGGGRRCEGGGPRGRREGGGGGGGGGEGRGREGGGRGRGLGRGGRGAMGEGGVGVDVSPPPPRLSSIPVPRSQGGEMTHRKTLTRLALGSLAALCIAAPAASAAPIDPVAPGRARQLDMHASTVQKPGAVVVKDARGESAAPTPAHRRGRRTRAASPLPAAARFATAARPRAEVRGRAARAEPLPAPAQAPVPAAATTSASTSRSRC